MQRTETPPNPAEPTPEQPTPMVKMIAQEVKNTGAMVIENPKTGAAVVGTARVIAEAGQDAYRIGMSGGKAAKAVATVKLAAAVNRELKTYTRAPKGSAKETVRSRAKATGEAAAQTEFGGRPHVQHRVRRAIGALAVTGRAAEKIDHKLDKESTRTRERREQHPRQPLKPMKRQRGQRRAPSRTRTTKRR